MAKRRAFDRVKVFSATMPAERARLGERVTEWLDANPRIRIADIAILQSSDARFHCISIVVFHRER